MALSAAQQLVNTINTVAMRNTGFATRAAKINRQYDYFVENDDLGQLVEDLAEFKRQGATVLRQSTFARWDDLLLVWYEGGYGQVAYSITLRVDTNLADKLPTWVWGRVSVTDTDDMAVHDNVLPLPFGVDKE